MPATTRRPFRLDHLLLLSPPPVGFSFAFYYGVDNHLLRNGRCTCCFYIYEKRLGRNHLPYIDSCRAYRHFVFSSIFSSFSFDGLYNFCHCNIYRTCHNSQERLPDSFYISCEAFWWNGGENNSRRYSVVCTCFAYRFEQRSLYIHRHGCKSPFFESI